MSRGTSWDADSLLRFLNLVCNQQNEALWQMAEAEPAKAEAKSAKAKAAPAVAAPVLVSAAPEASAPAPAAAPAAKAAAASAVVSVPAVSIPVAAPEAGAVRGYALAAAAGAAALAVIAWLVAKSRDENYPSECSSLAEPGSEDPSLSHPRSVTSDVDSAMGRMSNVLLRLFRIRVGLIISPIKDDDDGPPRARASDPEALTPQAAGFPADFARAPSPNGNGRSSGEAAAGRRKPSVSADQVLALLEEENQDVGRALDRLMAQQDSQASYNGNGKASSNGQYNGKL